MEGNDFWELLNENSQIDNYSQSMFEAEPGLSGMLDILDSSHVNLTEETRSSMCKNESVPSTTGEKELWIYRNSRPECQENGVDTTPDHHLVQGPHHHLVQGPPHHHLVQGPHQQGYVPAPDHNQPQPQAPHQHPPQPQPPQQAPGPGQEDGSVNQLLESIFGNELPELLGNQNNSQDDSGIELLDDLLEELENPKEKAEGSLANTQKTCNEVGQVEDKAQDKSVDKPYRYDGVAKFKAKPAYERCIAPDDPEQGIPKPFQIPNIPGRRNSTMEVISVNPNVQTQGFVRIMRDSSDAGSKIQLQNNISINNNSSQIEATSAPLLYRVSKAAVDNTTLTSRNGVQIIKYNINDQKRVTENPRIENIKPKDVLPTAIEYGDPKPTKPQNKSLSEKLAEIKAANLKYFGHGRIIQDSYTKKILGKKLRDFKGKAPRSFGYLKILPKGQQSLLRRNHLNTSVDIPDGSQILSSSSSAVSSATTSTPLSGSAALAFTSSSLQSASGGGSSAWPGSRTVNFQQSGGGRAQTLTLNKPVTTAAYTNMMHHHSNQSQASSYQSNQSQASSYQSNQLQAHTNIMHHQSNQSQFSTNRVLNQENAVKTNPILYKSTLNQSGRQSEAKASRHVVIPSRNPSVLNLTPWCNKNFYPKPKNCSLECEPNHSCNISCQKQLNITKEVVRYPPSHFLNMLKEKKQRASNLQVKGFKSVLKPAILKSSINTYKSETVKNSKKLEMNKKKNNQNFPEVSDEICSELSDCDEIICLDDVEKGEVKMELQKEASMKLKRTKMKVEETSDPLQASDDQNDIDFLLGIEVKRPVIKEKKIKGQYFPDFDLRGKKQTEKQDTEERQSDEELPDI